MKEIEINARTVEDALSIALGELNAARDEVEVEVLKKGRPGLFGMGAEDARVRVRIVGKPPAAPARPAPAAAVATAEAVPDGRPAASGDAAAIGTEVLGNILRLMGFRARVEAIPATDEAPLTLNVAGDDLGSLIGRRGQTLASLQYIVRLIVAERVKKWLPLAVDVSGYKQHRREALQKLARNLAEQVKANRRSVTMEPMPADERRIVHLALADSPEVTTQSVGEGEERKVVIQLKKS